MNHGERVKELKNLYCKFAMELHTADANFASKKLDTAIDAMQSALDDAEAKAKFLGDELECVTEGRNAAGEAAEHAYDELRAAKKTAKESAAKLYGLADALDYLHGLTPQQVAEARDAVVKLAARDAEAERLRAALEYTAKRLQLDIDDGSRPDQWSMEEIVRKANAALSEEVKGVE